MAKTVIRYVCQGCGFESPRWVGKCPECDAWNLFQEEIRTPEKSGSLAAKSNPFILPSNSGRPVPVRDVSSYSQERRSTGISELDRALGGGIVSGALMLVGGDPGIGKSTLMTQVAQLSNATVLYISGEESSHQIRLRSERLGECPAGFLVANETDINVILHHIDSSKPDLVIIDSIQTTYDSSLESAPGTVTQIRNCAAALTRYAKSGGAPVFLVGHVTKEGALAGPRVLEHIVDTVLYFEGDRNHSYRIVRAVKNRFGSTDEIGIFEMTETGLKAVENPSGALLSERRVDASGSAVTAIMEGVRPLLIEVQALVSRSFLSNPRRTATGIELNRLHMLLAVLEKRLGLKLGEQDVYVNVAGGAKLSDTAADLAITISAASNFRDQEVDPNVILLGEVGLGGEVRSVSQLDNRLREAARMGFTRAIVAKHNAPKSKNLGIEVITVSNVLEAMNRSLLPPRN